MDRPAHPAYQRVMLFRPLLLTALLVATPALAQKKPVKRPAATKAAPAKPDDAAVAAAEADIPPPPPGKFTLDTPIADLAADPAAKAVLDRDLPGLSDDDNLDKFKGMSLRQFQPMTGGQLTDAMLARVATDLGDPAAAAAPPAAAAASTPKREEEGR